MCSQNVRNELGSANIFQAPSRRIEINNFKKHALFHGSGVLGMIPGRRGVVNAPLDHNVAEDFSSSSNVMNGCDSSFFMDGVNCLNNSRKMDADIRVQTGAILEEILGVGRDNDVKTEGSDSKGSHEQEPLLGSFPDPSTIANSGLRSFAKGRPMRSSARRGLNGLLPTIDNVINVEEVWSGSRCDLNETRGIRFEIDHLSEIYSVLLGG